VINYPQKRFSNIAGGLHTMSLPAPTVPQSRMSLFTSRGPEKESNVIYTPLPPLPSDPLASSMHMMNTPAAAPAVNTRNRQNGAYHLDAYNRQAMQ
jgi:hypothetical protein